MNRYRIHTIGTTHFVQSRPAWWPFWFNRDFYTFYPEATKALEQVKALDLGVRVLPETTEEQRTHAAVEAATETLRGELAKAQTRVAELESRDCCINTPL